MIKLDANPVSLAYPASSLEHLESGHRLIVLIPTNTDFRAATQRVWALAHATGMQIRLLGLCEDTTEVPRLRRELITMASLLQDGKVCAESKVETGTNWIEVLKSNYETGDLLVCLTEQRTGLLRKPLSQILESNFKATVYMLSDISPRKSRANRFLQIGMWLGVIGVITGFGILQTKIVQLPEGWFQNILLILSIVAEFGLIWVWDGWFR